MHGAEPTRPPARRPHDPVAGAAMGGSMNAVAALWMEHRRWVAAVILAYKPASADVEDILQEVAMTLVAKVNTLREEANIRAWLRVVAINAARAAGRSQRAKPAARLSEIEPCEPVGEDRDHAASTERAQGVVRLLAALPEGYREPLMLKAVQGMRTREISLIMGIPEATVDTRISRARRMLREQAELSSPPPSLASDRSPASLNGVRS